MIYVFSPPNHHSVLRLKTLLIKHDPAFLLKKFTGRSIYLKEFKIVNQKLGKSASWLKGDGTGVDFSQGLDYVWLSVCHEMAHIFLWSPPKWSENKKIKRLLKRNKNYNPNDYYYHQYGYHFDYAVEQTLAFLLQAACENRIGFLRSLDWENWEHTFKLNGVLELAMFFWEPWVKYLKELKPSSKIDNFILSTLESFTTNQENIFSNLA
ncbi:MAG: hypothetical protein ABH867_04410 [Patescibacteria group bacterium]|nr:hypothetical protein [Patescibacteria group bacterium]